MTVDQKRKVLIRIAALQHDIEELKRVRFEIATNGYASATMSSGSGSKSYTRLDLGKIQETIAQLTSELNGLRAALKGSSKALPSQILTVYS